MLSACSGSSSSGSSSSSSGSSGGSSGGTVTTQPALPPAAWNGFGRNAQHTDLAATAAEGGVAAQNLNHVVWENSIDLAITTSIPPGATVAAPVPIHYGAPMITTGNNVLVGVKTATTGGFQMKAYSASHGTLLWSVPSDYIIAPYTSWIPVFGSTLTSKNRVYMPGSGGKVIYMDNVDNATVTPNNLVFYGSSAYTAAQSTFDSTVFINTPITSDSNGNIFFGFVVTGANPANLVSGFARIGADGTGSWVAASTTVTATGAVKPAMNAAPALSNDLSTLYVAVANIPASIATTPTGYLVALDSTTLAPKGSVQLIDPVTQQGAWVADDSSASPMVGPDGDVYFGVLESNFPSHNARGWLLHFDSTLATQKISGSFGWDNTPSVVPASLVASYKGTSSYPILSKYNNYAGLNTPTSDGKNKMAILDPNATEADPVEGNLVMNEVMTVLGPTPDTVENPTVAGAVREWCVNSAAVDPITKAAFMNSEDGFLYRWDLTTGTITQKIWLDNGYGQAYTPTAIGPDGTVYSINNSSVIAVTN